MTPGPGIRRTLLPKGFLASGVNCGVRKYRPDLGLILSERDAVGAGVLTQNACKGAPVLYCQGLLPSRKIRAIITNSGQANAATGNLGKELNAQMASATAKALGCKSEQILTASTGVIGVPLDIQKIEAGIPELVDRANDMAEPFAVAVLTTDLVPKTVTTEVTLKQGTVRITGICKGSGMIHPNMATMLGYLLTDLALEPEQAHTFLKTATDLSFNRISVDGDTSTNDSVFLLANGASEIALDGAEDEKAFLSALIEISICLAKSIARDGEGATKLIEVKLSGSPSLVLANQAARGLTLSPLLKSAVHGEDPNWGRILARLGAEGVPSECLETLSLDLQGERIFENGAPVAFDAEKIRKLLKVDTVYINANLHAGPHSAMAWGCDLSKQYVEINAAYST